MGQGGMEIQQMVFSVWFLVYSAKFLKIVVKVENR